jgi:hypothetical protein
VNLCREMRLADQDPHHLTHTILRQIQETQADHSRLFEYILDRLGSLEGHVTLIHTDLTKLKTRYDSELSRIRSKLNVDLPDPS